MKTEDKDGAMPCRTGPGANCARWVTAIRKGFSQTAGRSAACALALIAGVTMPVQAAPAAKHAPPPAAPVRFAVLSDIHLYDVKLGTEGAAFETYLATDLKMLHLSQAIFESALADIRASDVRFVVITGDLTKDGEVRNHVIMTQYLQKLEQAGIEVFVLPGNHDRNNTDATEYRIGSTKPVPSASPEVFRALYQRFGYGQALDHAPDSQSYLAEPAPGLWLLALDSAKSAESAATGHPVVSGRLTPATLTWALGKLQQAQTAGKKVIAFMHHGVNPHFLSEYQLFPDYLVDNWWSVGPQLAGAGLKVIFTGHYHSQDASNWTHDAQGTVWPSPLYDIETGSLVSSPCAYRIVELDAAGLLHVQSRRVNQIDADLGGMTFPQYAETFNRTFLPYRVIAELQYLFGISLAEAQAVAPWVVDALIANYAGDENPSQAMVDWLNGLITAPNNPLLNELGKLLHTLWVDPSRGDDNTLTVPVGG